MQLINNLADRINNHHDKIQKAIERVLQSGWLILGAECKKFEREFSQFLDVKECIGTANGTDAIELALKALDIKAGDQVATVANAGMYATSAILSVGALPFFMDVSIETCNTFFDEIKNAINHGVKVVIITHLYGLAVSEIQKIADFCKENKVLLLEDCAQAHGARINGKAVGTFGDAACFSFYPTKNLGAVGDGGAIVTNNVEYARKARLLSQYGWTEKYKVELIGARNSRLDEIQAAILFELLPCLEDANTKRRRIAELYNTHIIHPDVILPNHEGKEYVAHLYVIRATNRNALQYYLKSHQIYSEVHYPLPDHQQPVFNNKFLNVQLKNTEQLSTEVLSLPCYPEMSDESIKSVIEVINSWQV